MLLNERQRRSIMTDAILTELEEIETWVSALPENSTTVPHLIFEDLIQLIRFHFGVISGVPNYSPEPRRAVCVPGFRPEFHTYSWASSSSAIATPTNCAGTELSHYMLEQR